MICVIRIHGQIGLKRWINETLNRLRLRRKYSCIVLTNPKKETLGMVNRVRNFIAFGEINDKTFEKLIQERGQLIDKNKKDKFDAKKIVEELKKGKKYEDLNLKPFFRLHPPRKGINTKKHFPEGVLGNHKEKINNLLERML